MFFYLKMIELQNIQNAGKEEIIDLLLDEKRMPFEIYLPKTTVQFYNTNHDIALDYAKLCYCGHLLSAASDSFEYNFVQPGEFTSVLFIVSAADFTKLADAILEISKGFVNVDEEEDEFEFMENMSQYISDVEAGMQAIACESFYEVFKEYEEN